MVVNRPAFVLCLSAWFALACPAAPPASLRVATFNGSLNRTDLGTTLNAALNTPASAAGAKVKKVAEIIQRIRPDVLLLNEFDYDPAAPADNPRLFHDHFLQVSQNGQAAISFSHRFTAEPNTGFSSGYDLDNSGTLVTAEGTEAYGNDCYGFGRWKGQYGLVVFSNFPIQASAIRSFRYFLWKSMPGAAWPDNLATPGVSADWYSNSEKNIFRLSSKTHLDVPIDLGGQTLHFLVSHPTPPSFDGAEDRNGRRNHDEIRLWADYIAPWKSAYLKDDAGVSGGLPADARFVIAGDMNADPLDGDSHAQAIRQLTDHPLINASFSPSSLGGPEAAASQGGANAGHLGNPAHDTSDFGDSGGNPGNLRVDHVLPSVSGWRVLGGAVFWPRTSDPGYSAIGISDHRAVYLDLEPVPIPAQAVANLAISRSGADVTLRWKALAGHAYQIEHTADPAGSWTLDPSIPVTVHPVTLLAEAIHLNAPPGRRFYRVRMGFQ